MAKKKRRPIPEDRKQTLQNVRIGGKTARQDERGVFTTDRSRQVRETKKAKVEQPVIKLTPKKKERKEGLPERGKGVIATVKPNFRKNPVVNAADFGLTAYLANTLILSLPICTAKAFVCCLDNPVAFPKAFTFIFLPICSNCFGRVITFPIPNGTGSATICSPSLSCGSNSFLRTPSFFAGSPSLRFFFLSGAFNFITGCTFFRSIFAGVPPVTLIPTLS